MLKKLSSTLGDRLQSLRPSKQTLLRRLKQGGIVVIALSGFYLIAPPLWDAISVSPQQRVKPLKQRIKDLDKQIKASPTPSTADLKEIATLEKGRIDSENTIRTSLFQAVGGLLVVATLGISWRTLQVNEEKQTAERFSKAVEQLGNDNNIHVRLGGIYALEQIAKDAEEKYYWQVMETLTSYIRERSPYPSKAAKTHSSFVQAAIELTQTSESQSNEAISPLATDIQAVMTVLARRKHSYGHPLERHPLDLHGADLRKLQLPFQTQLNQANLSGTNLQGANLSGTNLQDAFLMQTNLQRAFLRSTNLQRAFLKDANLQKAILETANLQKAILWNANMQEAFVWNANLQRAHFKVANLQKIKFEQVYLGLMVTTFGIPDAIGLTWEQLDAAASYEGAILPDYLPPRQQPHTEKAQSAEQATESVQAEGEEAATPPEETPLAPPEF